MRDRRWLIFLLAWFTSIVFPIVIVYPRGYIFKGAQDWRCYHKWMQEHIERCQWFSPGDETRKPVEVVIEEYDTGDTGKRAAKFFLGSVLVAAVGVFIPVLHFAIVPGALLFGIVMAIRSLQMSQAMRRLQGQCPKCAASVTVETGRIAFQTPYWNFCPECKARLCVEAASE